SHAALLELRHALAADAFQLVELAETDRIGGAGLGAGGLQLVLEPVVAERAFPGAPVVLPAIDDGEGATHHATARAVADIGLHVDAVELGADDRAGGAILQAAGALAVLADVGGHEPGKVAAPLALDEGHVSPGGGAQVRGVVVGEPGEDEAVIGELV